MQAVRGAAGRRARNGLRIREAAAHTGRRKAEGRPEGERRSEGRAFDAGCGLATLQVSPGAAKRRAPADLQRSDLAASPLAKCPKTLDYTRI